MLERIAWSIVVAGVFIVSTIVGLFLVYLSYKLMQEGTMASQLFGSGIGIVGGGILAKVYGGLKRTSWAFAEFENERGNNGKAVHSPAPAHQR